MAWFGVEEWRGSPRTSAFLSGVYRVEQWRASDLLKNDKKRLMIKQSRQTRVYLGFIRPNSGTKRSGPMAGLAGCTFHLIPERTYFWPRTDQAYLAVFGRCPQNNHRN